MSERAPQPVGVEIDAGDGVRLRAFEPPDAPELFRLMQANRAELEKVDIYVPQTSMELVDALSWPIPSGRVDYCVRAENAIVGQIDFLPHTPTVAEIIYWINRQHQGHGLAARAIKALADYAFSETPTRVIRAWVRSDNEPSQKTLAKAGFEHTMTNGATETKCYELECPTGKVSSSGS